MIKKVVILLNVTLLITLIFSFSAFANTLGGKWETNIGYYATSSHPYYSQDVQGATNWNNVCSKRKWYSTSVLYATVSPVYNYYGETGWNAQGQPGPSITSGTYTYGDLRYNRTYMDNYTTAKRTAISTHEHGHIMGLAHNTETSTSQRSIMYGGGSSVYFDQWRLTAPTSRDTTDINALYN